MSATQYIVEVLGLNGAVRTVEVYVAGPPGAAATVSVGTVSTGDEGSEAAVENIGTALHAILDFTIPIGATGGITEEAQAALDEVNEKAVIVDQRATDAAESAESAQGSKEAAEDAAIAASADAGSVADAVAQANLILEATETASQNVAALASQAEADAASAAQSKDAAIQAKDSAEAAAIDAVDAANTIDATVMAMATALIRTQTIVVQHHAFA